MASSCYLPPINYHAIPKATTSNNFDRGTYKNICDGRSPAPPLSSYLPPINYHAIPKATSSNNFDRGTYKNICDGRSAAPPLSSYLPPINHHAISKATSSNNFDRGTYKNFCDGRPPGQPSLFGPSLAQSATRYPTSRSDAFASPNLNLGSYNLPPIDGIGGRMCGNHPRDDCCRVPQCNPCPPMCPVGTCVERVQPFKPIQNYEPPAEPFSGNSLYRASFQGCQGPPAESAKRTNAFMASTGRMADVTSYREQFNWKPYQPVERHQVKNDFVPSCQPFDGTSTYRVDFQGSYGSPAEIVKRSTFFEGSSGKFNGLSTYRHEFVPYCPSEYRYARGDTIRPNENSVMSCSPFDSASTYQMEFVPKFQQKTPSARPKDKSGPSSAKFGGWSTYRNDFLPFYFCNPVGRSVPLQEECCRPYCPYP